MGKRELKAEKADFIFSAFLEKYVALAIKSFPSDQTATSSNISMKILHAYVPL